MNGEPTIRKVSLPPIQLLKDAYQLVDEQYWLFVGITFVGVLIGSAAPAGVLLGPMMCGIYLCFLHRMEGGTADFKLLFKGFDYFLDSLVATLIMVAVMFVVLIPVIVVFLVAFFALAAGSRRGPPVPLLIGLELSFYLVMLILSLAVSVPFVFVFHLIVDRGLKAIPAIKTSLRAVRANFMGILWMMVVFTFLSFLAALCCYFPAILLMPLTFGGICLAYRSIFPEEGVALQEMEERLAREERRFPEEESGPPDEGIRPGPS
jgi:hypothetical protein